MEWWCGVASRWRRSVVAVRAKCGCGPAGGSRPQMAPAGGGDGFSRVRPASLCSLARERCVVWAQLFFEVRAAGQSSDCVLWRMVPLGATLLSTHSAAATAGGTASGMAEIGRVKLQFAAARHGTAPLGTILDSTPFSLCPVSRKHAKLFAGASATAAGSFSATLSTQHIACMHTAAANTPNSAPGTVPAQARV